MTTKTKNKTTKTVNTTALPMDLIDLDLYNKLDNQSGLQGPVREIIAIYLMVNKLGGSAQSRITALVDQGKQGYEKIITIACWLKDNQQDTATLKVQVNRAMTKANTGLSLQGLGKGQTPVIEPKQDKKGGKDTSEGDSESVLTIQYDNDSFDQTAFEQLFNEWDFETQQYFVKRIKSIAKK
jgi:hypothetical protein